MQIRKQWRIGCPAIRAVNRINLLICTTFIGIVVDQWGPGPESAGATGDAGQVLSRAAGRIERGVIRYSGNCATSAPLFFLYFKRYRQVTTQLRMLSALWRPKRRLAGA